MGQNCLRNDPTMKKKYYRAVTIPTRNPTRKGPTAQMLPSSVYESKIVTLPLMTSWKHPNNKGGIAKNINVPHIKGANEKSSM